MDLLFRQIWALMRKNLLLVCLRRPITTFIRALAIPLVVILVVAFSKTWFASSGHWGVSSAHQVSGLQSFEAPMQNPRQYSHSYSYAPSKKDYGLVMAMTL
jgi:hypothetical protein